MAVLISDNTNPAYDGKWNTPNSWYRVEDHNLATDGYGSMKAIYAGRTASIPVTFANSGNCKGVVLPYTPYGVGQLSNPVLDIHLQKKVGVVTFDVSTEKVLMTSHGLINDDIVTFVGTGVVPGGISNDLNYYFVINQTTNDFQLSLTSGGAAINLTGTPSGTTTCWTTKTFNTYTKNEVVGNGISTWSTWITPFRFTTPYAIDTNANTWRFWIYSNSTVFNSIYLSASNYPSAVLDYCFATWCDTQATWSDDDCPIVADKLEIDGDIKILGVAGKSNASVGHYNSKWAWVCSNVASQLPDDTIKIYVPSNVAASYTLQITGQITCGGYSGIQLGDSLANPIPYSNQFKILFKQSTIDTGGNLVSLIKMGWFWDGASRSASANTCTWRAFGEIPTGRSTTLASQANANQAKIITTDDMTGIWQIGDLLTFTHVNISGTASMQRTITGISGTEITLNSNISTYNILSGATVLNYERYGIKIYGDGANVQGALAVAPANSYTSGVLFYDVSFNTTVHTIPRQYTYQNYTDFPDTGKHSQLVIEDCASFAIRAFYGFDNNGFTISPLGTIIRRLHMNYSKPPTFLSPIYSPTWSSGQFIYQDNIHTNTIAAFNVGYSCFSVNSGFLLQNTIIENNIFSNVSNTAAAGTVCVVGFKNIYRNNTFFGVGNGAPFIIKGAIRTECYGNKIDKSLNAYFIDNQFGSKINIHGELFGQLQANTYDIGMNTGGFYDVTFRDCSGETTIDLTNIPLTTIGNAVKIVNKNNVTNDDVVYNTYGVLKRCGHNLADTTVHTASTDKYSLRFESNSGVTGLEWTQDVPTSNIQNKTMSVYVWCKINTANYYAGTNVMPRLTVNYDDGTVVYAEAGQTTDWQLLSVPFTPTTTFGKIVLTLSTMTDKTGSDAYVYFDDIGVLYPAGHQLNLGGLNDWAEALPVTPSIATNLSPSDVWAVPIAGMTGDGTIGKFIKGLLTVGKFLGLK